MDNKPPIKQKYIETSEILWELFEEYQIAAKANPYIQKDWVGKDGNEVAREKERPLSFVGFEVYLYKQGIIHDLSDYERNRDNKYEAYSAIITRIKRFIEADQFEGATVGVYNHNIIARKLGLVDKSSADDKQDVTITVKRGDRHGKGNNTEYTPPGTEPSQTGSEEV